MSPERTAKFTEYVLIGVAMIGTVVILFKGVLGL